MKLVVWLAVCLGVGGCLRGGGGESGDCRTDADCDGECARTNECVEAGTAIRIELTWTIAGAPATDETCAPFESLEVIFHDDDEGREPTSYSPIPCRLARSTYDKMPPRLVSVELLAYDQAGNVVDSGTSQLEPTGTTVVTIDLQPP